MKEYLTKNSSGNYQLVNHRFSEDDIEVPSGAKYMTMPNKYFWRDELPHAWSDSKQKWTKNNGESVQSYIDGGYSAKIVWQRESLNDKIATAEVARQEEKHSHYKKDVSHLNVIDVYRVLELYGVESHAVGHAIKKLLCCGQRGAKGRKQDIQEAIDSLNRELEMVTEDEL
jgi:hypothetical protein